MLFRSIWLTAFQIEWEAGDAARAREILQKARENCDSGRVWMKSALLEWETGSFAEEEKLLKEGIGEFPEYAKLYMMLGSFYESSGKVEEARDTYRKGLLKCPFSVPLWLLYVELERKKHLNHEGPVAPRNRPPKMPPK